jgi:serine/threonine-protein kinase
MHPERVGPYLVDKKIGAGGMGTVYHGRHAETQEEAAIKVLPASLAREEGFVARFFREIEAMKKLVDPRVVKLYDSGVDGETYYYAMEFVDGETLTMRLRRDRRIPWRRNN